jgi:hypothetical protein
LLPKNTRLKFREEHRLSVVKNKMLRKVRGPKRDEVTGVETT